jgi:hypothetical protein
LRSQVQFQALMKVAAENAEKEGCSRQMALRELSFLCFFFEPDSFGSDKKGVGA